LVGDSTVGPRLNLLSFGHLSALDGAGNSI
jgi:hypothetical protein